MQVEKQQLKPDMEQQNGSKFGKQYIKAADWHPCLFNLNAENIMWNAGLDESQGRIKIAGRSINNLRYADDTTLSWFYKRQKNQRSNCQSTGSLKKQESSRKTSISALLTMPKPLTVWITINWKILRDWNTRPPDLPLEKFVCRSGSNS